MVHSNSSQTLYDIRRKIVSKSGKIRDILDKIIDDTTVNLPDVMIEDEFNRQLRGMENQMRYQGITVEDYVKYIGKTVDEFIRRLQDSNCAMWFRGIGSIGDIISSDIAEWATVQSNIEELINLIKAYKEEQRICQEIYKAQEPFLRLWFLKNKPWISYSPPKILL